MARPKTNPLENSKLKELLWRALDAEAGIIIRTNNFPRLRQRLYEIRKEEAEFECLSLHASPTDPNGELWIRKNAEEPTTTGQENT